MSSGGWWCFIKVAVMEEEVRWRPFDEGEMKGVGRWFGSAPSRCRRVAHGGAWRGGAPEEVAAARAFEGGRRPREGQLGQRPERLGLCRPGGNKAKRPIWAKNERKRKMGCRTIFSNFSNKDLILKTKDSNIFKPILN
jgi:hypothetical protein